MRLETLSCNHCGAPLEVGVTAQYVTCGHCGTRLAVRRTDTASFTEELQRVAEHTGRMAEDLEVIRLQNELERIDREWQLSRPRDSRRGIHPTEGPPSGLAVGMALAMGCGALVFVVFWIQTASSIGAPPIFPLFGLFFGAMVLMGITASVNGISQSQASYEEYQQQRGELLRQLEGKKARNCTVPDSAQ